jgi:hypothetical protein
MAEFRERRSRGLKQGSNGSGNGRSSLRAKLPRYLILVILIVGAYLLYDGFIRESLEGFWERNAAFLQAEYPEVDVTATLRQLEDTQQKRAKPASENTSAARQAAELPLHEAEISVARQFKPKELVMTPLSRELKTAPSTDFSIKKMPDGTEGASLSYALLKLSHFGLTQLVLVTQGEKSVLYVDRNHNLDLSDDVPPLVADTDAFAVTLAIPFYQATGIMGLDGEYRLWIYRPGTSGSLRYYPLTQLVGQITLDGRTYDALIMEGERTDANVLNDGILVDWNRDGKFDPESELVHSGQIVSRDKARYSITLVE